MIDKRRIQCKNFNNVGAFYTVIKLKILSNQEIVAACIVMWEKEIAIAHKRCLLGLWTQFISKGIAIYQIVALSW